MTNVLKVENLVKYYGNYKAVDRLSFSVEPGQVYGILGPNGSGKTTTLGIISGILNKKSGDFSWFGEDLTKKTKQRLGTILETPNFYPYLSGKKNLQINALIKNAPKKRIAESLDFVGLGEVSSMKFKHYSLGMKQRLAIAGAILNDPEVLILDEPTNGLDPSGIVDIRNMILDLAKSGKTILIASHLLDEVQKVCTHTVILKKGKILYDGAIEDKNSNDYEISSSNLEALEEAVKFSNLAYVKEINEDKIMVTGKDLTAENLNKMLAEQGIYLSHLQKKKVGLEKIFMDITGLTKK